MNPKCPFTSPKQHLYSADVLSIFKETSWQLYIKVGADKTSPETAQRNENSNGTSFNLKTACLRAHYTSLGSKKRKNHPRRLMKNKKQASVGAKGRIRGSNERTVFVRLLTVIWKKLISVFVDALPALIA